MTKISFILAVLLVLLQIRLWKGDGSVVQLRALKQEIAVEQEKVAHLKERNQTLMAEVDDLKHQLSALEERARNDLGMIKRSETFYQYKD